MKSILLVMGLSVVSGASVYGSQSQEEQAKKESSPPYCAKTLFSDPALQKKAEELVKESKEQSQLRKKSIEDVRTEKVELSELEKRLALIKAKTLSTTPSSAPSSFVLEKEPDSPSATTEAPKASEEGGRPEHFSSMGWKRF